MDAQRRYPSRNSTITTRKKLKTKYDCFSGCTKARVKSIQRSSCAGFSVYHRKTPSSFRRGFIFLSFLTASFFIVFLLAFFKLKLKQKKNPLAKWFFYCHRSGYRSIYSKDQSQLLLVFHLQ